MKRKLTIVTFLVLLVAIISVRLPIFADVGDFETYDSGSDWSSSDYDYDDDDYDYSSSSSSGDVSFGDIVFALIIIVVIIVLAKKFGGNGDSNSTVSRTVVGSDTRMPDVDEDEIVNKIKEKDENFNMDEFKSWTRDLFTKLQYCWSDRDWTTIRCFESNELYEQHSKQLERYKENKQINKIERVSVNWVKLLDFEQSGDKDVLTVVLNSKMIDYIIDEQTQEVLKGDKNTNHINSYKLTFIRKTGVKTKVGESTVNTTNCPNCGAPTQITSSGKCEYCGSVITTGEFNWVLSNLERYNG